ncbi:MAG: hypothetical protein JWQ38_2060 [Flavipsychrobacter sp.]|nr:hypothetical protein [Flavipsychrobacter sp.]
MKAASILLLVTLSLPVVSIAQDRRYDRGHERQVSYTENGSALTIFSENGDQFFLIINGVKQNTYPQTRVRVEDLPQVTNDIQIIFNDNRTQAIQKKITFANPVDDKAINMVLKIERMQGGYPVLTFHKCSQLMRDYRPEQGEYVMHYGRDVVRQVNNVPPPPPSPPAPRAMDANTFREAKQSIAASSFESTKISTAKTILTTNYICADQVMEICRMFSFDDSKLDFAKYAYSRTVDQNNYFKVSNVFSFSSSKESLNTFISNGGR